MAAWSACSCVSASTSATGSPFQWMDGSCMIGRSLAPAARGLVMKMAGGAMRGAFSCVITSTTPGAATASAVSSVAIRPCAIVLCTSAA